MSDRKRNADDIKRSLDDRRYWRQARKEVDGIFYDTMEAQSIGYWCPVRWGGERYYTSARLYRTYDREYFLHKELTDTQSRAITDEIKRITMEDVHNFMDHRECDDYITDDEKDEIKHEDKRNKRKREHMM